MKALFIYSRTEKNLAESGEAKKALMQVGALNRLGVETKIVWHDRTGFANKLWVRIPLFMNYSKKFRQQIIIECRHHDFVYIRKDIFDLSFLLMIKGIKKETQSKIVVEIPTFPYDKEWLNYKDWPMLVKDRLARHFLHHYIDKIVLCAPISEKVFEVPTIIIGNGIDTCTVRRKDWISDDVDTIKLLGVACVEKWHGYDRMIRGLQTYYSQCEERQKVEFHIVGNGSVIKKLKRQVSASHLERYVFFHGPLYGKELDEMFDKCDIGVASLAAFRKGIVKGRELKLREYMARGIPFVYSNDDADIEKTGFLCGLKVPHDESPINIEEIVTFYHKILDDKLKKDELTRRMNQYAKDYLSWENQLQSVYEYMNTTFNSL